MYRSEAVEVYDIYAVNSKCIMIKSTARKDYNDGNQRSNIVIAVLTTSSARRKLLSMMENLDSDHCILIPVL